MAVKLTEVLSSMVSSFSRIELALDVDVTVLNEPVIVAVSSSGAALELDDDAFSSSVASEAKYAC